MVGGIADISFISVQRPQKAYCCANIIYAKYMYKLFVFKCMVGNVIKLCMSYKKLHYLQKGYQSFFLFILAICTCRDYGNNGCCILARTYVPTDNYCIGSNYRVFIFPQCTEFTKKYSLNINNDTYIQYIF